MIDSAILEDFIYNFYGYGNYRAPYWLVGMEEGGGESVENINLRLNAWDQRGRKELEDVADYHRAIEIDHLFAERPNLQKTWNKLIRAVLSAQQVEFNTDDVREYQRSKLGRFEGETCLMELMPLPSRNSTLWLYGENTNLTYLANRKTYRRQVMPERIRHLQTRIREYQPKAVIFYGTQYKKSWQAIAGELDWQIGETGIKFVTNGKTVFVMAKHPTATGVSNAYYAKIGWLIRQNQSDTPEK